MHEMTTPQDDKRDSPLARFQDVLPLYFTYSVVISTSFGFGLSVVIRDTLIQQSRPLRAGGQFIILSLLFGLTLTSLIVAANRPPGQPDASITPDGAKEARKREQEWKEWDEDDIPLGQLRRYRPQQQGPYILERGNMVPYPAGEPSYGTTLDLSPSPLAIGPLVPKTAADAGLETVEDGLVIGTAIEEEENGDDERLLASDRHPKVRHEERKSLFAKNSSGGHRWCSKCDAWKPDRCHHCRSCRRCTLKMDHHCMWINACVGYRNYKPFLLFVSYGTLLALFVAIESCISLVHYLTRTPDYDDDSTISDLIPVSFLVLTFVGAFFTMSIGGLAGYHWYLVIHDKTTLEDITHTYPSALMDESHMHEGQAGWRGDHLLTRPERIRLREEVSALNVYDLGWRRNVRTVLLGSDRTRGFPVYLRALWPLATTHDRLDASAGHYFDYDTAKLERLQELTAELRLGYRRDPEQADVDEGDDNNDNEEDA